MKPFSHADPLPLPVKLLALAAVVVWIAGLVWTQGGAL